MNDRKPLWPVASLVVLTGLNMLDYIDRWILASVFTPLKADLHLSDEQLGTLQTAFMCGYFLTSPIFGYLGDRMARRWLIAAGVAVWSLGTLLSGHANAFVSLLMFRILVGFGEASFGTISPGWIADLFRPERRNYAISVFYLAIPIGSALGYVIGGTIAAHYGWRAAFMWVGYPGVLLALVLFLLREPPRGAADPNATPQSDVRGWKSYARLLGYKRYVLVVAGYAAETFAMGGFAAWAPAFLYRVHHLNNEAANHFFGASVAATGLLATVLGGWLGSRWQRKFGVGYEWVLVISAVGALPTGFLAFMLPSLATAKLMLVAAMFFIFFATGPVNTLILETVPATMRASAVAASIFSIHMFGDLWSPPIVGWLSDRWGDLQRAVLFVLPSTLLISAAFWLWLLVVRVREKPAAAAPALAT